MTTANIFKIVACVVVALVLTSLALNVSALVLLNDKPLAALMALAIFGAPAAFMWSMTYRITYYARGK